MKGLRLGVTFFIVLVLFLLSVFQMQLRGYEKVARIEEWTIYYHEEDACLTMEEVFYSDEEYDYIFHCVMSERYLVKRGFEEYSLVYALENDYLDISEIEGIIDFGQVQKTD